MKERAAGGRNGRRHKVLVAIRLGMANGLEGCANGCLPFGKDDVSRGLRIAVRVRWFRVPDDAAVRLDITARDVPVHWPSAIATLSDDPAIARDSLGETACIDSRAMRRHIYATVYPVDPNRAIRGRRDVAVRTCDRAN